MRHLVSLATLGVGSVLATLLLTPTPDAITMLYYLICFLGMSALGYWLGNWAGRAGSK